MGKKNRIIIAALLLIAASYLIVSGIQKAQENKKAQEQAAKLAQIKKIRFTTWNTAPYINLPTWVGIEKGIFKKNGLDLQTMGADNPNATLVNNTSDAAVSGVGSSIPLAVAGGHLQYVATIFRNGPFIIITTKKDKSQIKTVGVATQNSLALSTITKALGYMGVDKNNISLTVVGPETNQIQALSSGGVDAIGMSKPTYETISEKFATELAAKGAYIAYDFSENKVSITPNIILVNGDFLNKNPDSVKLLLKSFSEINQFIVKNQQETISIYAKKTGQGEKNAQISIETYVKALQGSFLLPPDINPAQSFLIDLVTQNPDAKNYNLDKFINYSFVK